MVTERDLFNQALENVLQHVLLLAASRPTEEPSSARISRFCELVGECSVATVLAMCGRVQCEHELQCEMKMQS